MIQMLKILYMCVNVSPLTHTQEKEKGMQFNAKQLIDDCGGVRAVAEALGKHRTAPYRMMKTRHMTTWQLEILKYQNPDINLDDYFEDRNDYRNTE